jgi:S-adenosylmethionine hydrolase
VILSPAPSVRIVEVTHAIAPQDVRGGAIILDEITPPYPSGSLHVAVIDPGVGSARALVNAEIGD